MSQLVNVPTGKCSNCPMSQLPNFTNGKGHDWQMSLHAECPNSQMSQLANVLTYQMFKLPNVILLYCTKKLWRSKYMHVVWPSLVHHTFSAMTAHIVQHLSFSAMYLVFYVKLSSYTPKGEMTVSLSISEKEKKSEVFTSSHCEHPQR